MKFSVRNYILQQFPTLNVYLYFLQTVLSQLFVQKVGKTHHQRKQTAAKRHKKPYRPRNSQTAKYRREDSGVTLACRFLFYCKNSRKTGQVKNRTHIFGQVAQHEAAAVRDNTLIGRKDYTQPGTADILHSLAFKDYSLCALLDQWSNGLLQLRRSNRVKTSFYNNDFRISLIQYIYDHITFVF